MTGARDAPQNAGVTMIAALDRMAEASDRGLELALVVRWCFLEGRSVDAVAGRVGQSPSSVRDLRSEAIEELFKLTLGPSRVVSAQGPPRPHGSARRRLRAKALALREQALRRLFRLSRAEWEKQRAGVHPSSQTLLAFGLGDLGASEATEVRHHMLHCDECLAASRGFAPEREVHEAPGRPRG